LNKMGDYKKGKKNFLFKTSAQLMSLSFFATTGFFTLCLEKLWRTSSEKCIIKCTYQLYVQNSFLHYRLVFSDQ